jgi:hypothetical protein
MFRSSYSWNESGLPRQSPGALIGVFAALVDEIPRHDNGAVKHQPFR